MTSATIAEIRLYKLPFPFRGGGFATSYGRRSRLDNLLIELVTDDGLTGYGEICRLSGKSEPPVAGEAVNAAVKHLQSVLGAPAHSPASLRALLGKVPARYSNVACGLETAAYDLFGKMCDLPLHDLMGGVLRDTVPYYFCVGQNPPHVMAAEAKSAVADGFSCIQIKIGGEQKTDLARTSAILNVLGPDNLLLADANGGWEKPTAVEIMTSIRDPRLRWEEPCATYEENRALAESIDAPIILDQCMNRLSRYAELAVDKFAAGSGLKPSIIGGLTPARTARDLCIDAGIAMKIDDCWGVEASNAACLHLALGTPDDLLIAGIDMTCYFEDRLCYREPDPSAVSFAANYQPGLGIDVNTLRLGNPIIHMH